MTGGKVFLTAGIDALPSDVKAIVIRRVATFADFTPDNDPHGEHDFGSFEVAGRKIFWKSTCMRNPKLRPLTGSRYRLVF